VGFNQRHRTEYLYGSSDKVIAVAVTPEERIAISGSVDNTLKLWDLTIGTEHKTLTGHTDYIKVIAITGDGPAGYGRDITIAIWMLER
jgi:WD40 repeat protein